VTFHTAAWQTDAAVARLRVLWADGVEISAIADELGTTVGGISNKVRRLGLPPRKNRGAWATDAAIARMRELLAIGKSASEIGRELGTTKGAILGKLHRLALSGQPRSPPPAKPPAPMRAPSEPAVVRSASRRRPPRKPRAPVAPVTPPRPRVAPAECCWPIGLPGKRDFHFCEAPTLPGRPYCAEHTRIAYVPLRSAQLSADNG
jgi:GcrA cell cycle regulator